MAEVFDVIYDLNLSLILEFNIVVNKTGEVIRFLKAAVKFKKRMILKFKYLYLTLLYFKNRHNINNIITKFMLRA